MKTILGARKLLKNVRNYQIPDSLKRSHFNVKNYESKDFKNILWKNVFTNFFLVSYVTTVCLYLLGCCHMPWYVSLVCIFFYLCNFLMLYLYILKHFCAYFLLFIAIGLTKICHIIIIFQIPFCMCNAT